MARFEPDEELVRKLSGLLDETGLTEIEYEANGQRIRVARTATAVASLATPVAGTAPRRAAPDEDGGAAAAVPDSVPENALLSPMVGTAYAAPEPGGQAFVAPGDSVHEGQTLLIIEAMKVMNPIPSPRAGRVMQIFVQDGQPVEYGEPLMIIE